MRYVALLRGVSPMNLKMADLKRCLEEAGFSEVRTVLSSGNAVFDCRPAQESAIERKIEAALKKSVGRVFETQVRSVEYLQRILEGDPFEAFRLKLGSKRVVTFLKDKPAKKVVLPPEKDGARILEQRGREVYSAYVPGPKGPVFMTLIEKTFGKEVTTRTWDTIRKIAR